MPRLFTALAIPAAIADALAFCRGGLVGARWIEPADYHLTLRFVGDVDGGTARDLAAALDEIAPHPPVTITLDRLDAFGGEKPRAIIARAAPSPALLRLQAEQERLAREVGLAPEGRKFTPHVTLARLRRALPSDVAAHLARQGRFAPLTFAAEQVVLFSARDSVGGGPYVAEAVYRFAPAPEAGAPELDPPASFS